MIGYSGRETSKTPVVVFRKEKDIIVTAGNFTDDEQHITVQVGKKFLNVTLQPHSFNTYVGKYF
jgi:glucosylceramidase